MNYKIKIGENNQKLCELVQKKLFGMGYGWKHGGQKVRHTDSFFLHINNKDKIIMRSNSLSCYLSSNDQELSIKDVLDGNLPE